MGLISVTCWNTGSKNAEAECRLIVPVVLFTRYLRHRKMGVLAYSQFCFGGGDLALSFVYIPRTGLDYKLLSSSPRVVVWRAADFKALTEHTFFLTSDGCRTLIFHPPMNNHYLYGHVNKSYVIGSKAHCEHKCYLDADCVSTNTKILHTGKFLCELSNSDHKLHPADLKFGQNFTYTATEVKRLESFYEWELY